MRPSQLHNRLLLHNPPLINRQWYHQQRKRYRFLNSKEYRILLCRRISLNRLSPSFLAIAAKMMTLAKSWYMIYARLFRMRELSGTIQKVACMGVTPGGAELFPHWKHVTFLSLFFHRIQ